MNEVSLRFRYSETDYVRAMRAHYRTVLRLWLDIPSIAAFILLGIYLWHSAELHWLSIASFVVSGAFALMLVAAFVIIPPLVFRREPKFGDEYSLTFSPECIHFKTMHFDSRLEWSTYSRVLVDRYSYVLYYGLRSVSVIPKRVFQSPEQQATFERLLAEHVPTIIRKK